MKTISQFAAEKGVSVQTIYRMLNKIKQETGKCLTEKINGIAHITEDGKKELNKRLTDVKQVLNAVKQAESDEIFFLREQNKSLLEELVAERSHSREQADKLSDLAAQLVELSRNNQLLLGAEQSRTNPALLRSDEDMIHKVGKGHKKGFLQRLFGKINTKQREAP